MSGLAGEVLDLVWDVLGSDAEDLGSAAASDLSEQIKIVGALSPLLQILDAEPDWVAATAIGVGVAVGVFVAPEIAAGTALVAASEVIGTMAGLLLDAAGYSGLSAEAAAGFSALGSQLAPLANAVAVQVIAAGVQNTVQSVS